MAFDDVGFFGLPTSSPSPSRKRRRTTNDGAAVENKEAPTVTRGRNKSHQPRRGWLRGHDGRQGPPLSTDDGGDSDSDGGSSDDDVALSRLARPARAPDATSGAAAVPAAVTPGARPPSRVGRPAACARPGLVASAARNPRRSPPNNPAPTKRKQLRLHSFLRATPAEKPSASNLASRTSGRGPQSFVTAAAALKKADGIERQCSPFTNDDDLETFSSDDEHCRRDKSASRSLRDKADTLTEQTSEMSNADKAEASVHESEADRLVRPRRHHEHNPSDFALHGRIFGHHLLHTTTVVPAESNVSNRDDMPPAVPGGEDELRLLRGKSGDVNVLSRLFQRSTLSAAPGGTASRLRRFAHAGRHWNACATVRLSGEDPHAASDDGPTAAVGREVTALAFDREGVLFAMGDARGRVRIYDFDDVYALDRRRRNEKCGFVATGQGRAEEAQEARDARAAAGEGAVPSRIGATGHARERRNRRDEQTPHVQPARAHPVLSFRCRKGGGNHQSGARISSLLWSPRNQDHLAVVFANQPEVHMYDVARPERPCLQLVDAPSRSLEVVRKAIFVPCSAKSSSALQMLTGGNYGTVKLWSIVSKPPSSPKQLTKTGNLTAKCLWSAPVFGSKGGEGVCDIIVLPSTTSPGQDHGKTTPATAFTKKPLVLLAGNASSLSLLDTGKCTRKAFSTTVTPTVAASWDIHRLVRKELSKMDPQAELPARRWMAVRLSLLEHGSDARNCGSWFKIGMVAKSGWMFVAELAVGYGLAEAHQSQRKPDIRLCIHIIHRTPRVQVVNSSKEKLEIPGGMALQFSLPEEPVPSAVLPSSDRCGQQHLVWLGDVKAKRYIMPSKDKYVLCEEHGTVSSSGDHETCSTMATGREGEGLILARFDRRDCVCARLPLPSNHGPPLSLALHPSGEWMVVGYGMNGKGGTPTPLELVSMRKLI